MHCNNAGEENLSNQQNTQNSTTYTGENRHKQQDEQQQQNETELKVKKASPTALEENQENEFATINCDEDNTYNKYSIDQSSTNGMSHLHSFTALLPNPHLPTCLVLFFF